MRNFLAAAGPRTKSYIVMSSDCLSTKLYLLSNRAVFGEPVHLLCTEYLLINCL